MATAASGIGFTGSLSSRPDWTIAFFVKPGVTRPPSTMIIVPSVRSPARRPAQALSAARPVHSRCTIRLAIQ